MTEAIPTYRLPTTTSLELPLVAARLNPEQSLEWDTVPDRHTFYAIFWIREGMGKHFIDFVAHEIRPNSLFIMRPNQTHFFDVTASIDGYTLFFTEEIIYNNPFSQQVMKLFYVAEQHPAYYPSAERAQHLTETMRHIYTEFQQKQAGFVEALNQLSQFLLIQLQRIYRDRIFAGRTEAESQLTAEFQHLVGQHFATLHRLSEYAERLNVSASYLNMRVKSVTGRSAATHIRRRIVMEAMRLLTHTEMSAAQIAQTIGFEDSSYFGRFFKRETGQTPIAFRRSSYGKYHNAAT